MKKLSMEKLVNTVITLRKKLKISQQDLASKTGINRSVLSKFESGEYTPSLSQLEALAGTLGFDPTIVFFEEAATTQKVKVSPLNIAIAGTGYVGLCRALYCHSSRPAQSGHSYRHYRGQS